MLNLLITPWIFLSFYIYIYECMYVIFFSFGENTNEKDNIGNFTFFWYVFRALIYILKHNYVAIHRGLCIGVSQGSLPSCLEFYLSLHYIGMNNWTQSPAPLPSQVITKPHPLIMWLVLLRSLLVGFTTHHLRSVNYWVRAEGPTVNNKDTPITWETPGIKKPDKFLLQTFWFPLKVYE